MKFTEKPPTLTRGGIYAPLPGALPRPVAGTASDWRGSNKVYGAIEHAWYRAALYREEVYAENTLEAIGAPARGLGFNNDSFF